MVDRTNHSTSASTPKPARPVISMKLDMLREMASDEKTPETMSVPSGEIAAANAARALTQGQRVRVF